MTTCCSHVRLGCPVMFSKTHLPGSIKPQFLLCVLTPFLDATYECRPSGKFPGGPVVRGASLVWLNSKESACIQETQETRIQSLGWEDPLEKGMATCSSILAWKIPRTEEPGGLHSMGSQRVRHD